MSMAEFLDAHYKGNSVHNEDLVPPFFFPKERVSGPDIVFVVRFIGTDGESDMLCPVFVQLKLRNKLDSSDAEKARKTVQPAKINNHGIDIKEYSKPHQHYISLIISYPAEIAKFFKNDPLTVEHTEGITEIALTIDDKNIRKLFAAEYVDVLDRVKRDAGELTAGLERAKRARL